MTNFEVCTLTLGVVGFVSNQITSLVGAVQARRAASSSNRNAHKLEHVHALVNGQTDKLVKTASELAHAVGHREGVDDAKKDAARFAKALLDDARERDK